MDKDNMESMGEVRIRLCFGGHEETVVGEMVGFDLHFSGFSATQGFGLINWYYEGGQPEYLGNVQGKKHDKPLFVKWESVFVIETLEKTSKLKQLISGNRRNRHGI